MKISTILAAGIAATAMIGSPAHADIRAQFSCADGRSFEAAFSPPDAAKGEVELTFSDGKVLKLPQVISADGGRYEADGTEFWVKGNGGTLSEGGKSTTCEAKP